MSAGDDNGHLHPVEPDRSEGPVPSPAILVFSFLLLAVASIAYLVFIVAPEGRAEVLNDWQTRLVSTASDRQVAIERWVQDLHADARTLAGYPTAVYVLSGRRGPPYPFDPELGPEVHLRRLFSDFVETHGYVDAAAFDANGELVAGSPGTPDQAGLASLVRTATAGEPVLALLSGERNLVAVGAPIRDSSGQAVGAAVIEADADRFIFHLLDQMPGPSTTSETLLVTRRNGQVVYVSPLQKTDAPPGTLGFPMDSTAIAAVAATGGAVGPGTYRDYAGAEVLAAARPIAGAPWILVAKVDLEEAQADFRDDLDPLVAAIIALLIGALGVGFGVRRWQHQRLTSAVLREQARFAAVLDHANDPIFFLDPEGRILDVNRRTVEFYGIPREELIGEQASVIRAEEYEKRSAEDLNRVLGEGDAVMEVEHVLASGERVPVESSTRTVELEGQTVVISIIHDLRERKAAEEAVRRTKERYRTLVENLPDLIARFDEDLTCRFVSVGQVRPSPFAVDDPEGRTLDQLGLPEGSVDPLRHALRHVFDSGADQELELSLPGPDHDRTFDWRVVPERDADGRVAAAVMIVRETTERHALEHQLRQSQKMEAVGRLAGGVAHDFNNIITSIQGYATLVRDELGAGQALSEDIEEIIQSAERAAALTRQLLAFSRRQIFEPRAMGLGQVVLGMEDMLSRLIGEDIAMEVDIDRTGSHVIRADPSQIEQVLLNLVVNARDAMPNGGRLRIRVSETDWNGDPPAHEGGTGRAVRLSVTDTGFGIDPALVDRIFEPFFTTKTADQGTGLGLSTVYGIVEQSGGTIEVETEPGEGTSIHVSFPQLEASPDLTAIGRPGETVPPRRTEATILLVEDEPGVRGVARRVLEREGYRVVGAASGEEALERAAELDEAPRLLLTDMVMPGMSGRELVQRVRTIFPGCRALLMSGYTEDAVVREQSLDDGTIFLQKPFTPDELKRKVAGLLAGDRDG